MQFVILRITLDANLKTYQASRGLSAVAELLVILSTARQHVLKDTSFVANKLLHVLIVKPSNGNSTTDDRSV